MAPGNQEDCGAIGCHYSLARPGTESGPMFRYKGGCEGCHYYVSHHDTRTPVAYRFLEGHGTGRYVIGREDPDWEEPPVTSTKHNEYKGDPGDSGTSGTSDLADSHGMSSFCKGCHQDFHVQSDGSAWIRHPSDAVLPDSGEYLDYVTYNPMAPVARPDPMNVGDPGIVNHGAGGDMVMCLSCHRAHGSPYPDMLRWDYAGMIAGGGGSGGCFTCHTQKN